MDPSSTYKFIIDHIVDWSRVTFLTLVDPVGRFDLVGIDDQVKIIGSVEDNQSHWLNPKLIGFAVLSIILGHTINVMIPGRREGPVLLASVIVIFVFWLVSSSVLYVFCKLLRGKGKYLETLSVALQVSATLYVVNSFLAFVFSSLILVPEVSSFLKGFVIGSVIVESPVYIFFIFGTLSNMMYVPLSMKPVHSFGWLRTGLIAVFPPVIVWLSIAIYMQYGLVMNSLSMLVPVLNAL